MKIHLYKVLGFDTDNEPMGWDTIDSVKVMTLDDLRKEFLWVYNNGGFSTKELSDYKVDTDYAKENWDDINTLSAGTMVDMLNDICNYGGSYWYLIAETDIEIGE